MNDLAKITQIFMLPSTFLVVALGVAGTEPLKVFISALGLISGVLWIWGAAGMVVLDPPPGSIRKILQYYLPILFLVAWGLSFLLHGYSLVKS